MQFAEVVFPARTNHYGTLFGGQALLLMGQAAFMAATRHARSDVVMARCSDVEFLAPVPEGQVLHLTAHITRTGRSSMTVQVNGTAENPRTGHRQPVLLGAFEMVAVDAKGKPQPMAQRS